MAEQTPLLCGGALNPAVESRIAEAAGALVQHVMAVDDADHVNGQTPQGGRQPRVFRNCDRGFDARRHGVDCPSIRAYVEVIDISDRERSCPDDEELVDFLRELSALLPLRRDEG